MYISAEINASRWTSQDPLLVSVCLQPPFHLQVLSLPCSLTFHLFQSPAHLFPFSLISPARVTAALSLCFLASGTWTRTNALRPKTWNLYPLASSTFSLTNPTAEEGPLAQLTHTAHRREKRCSCENQKDKECIFFCHIGIVWVNTPSHVVPYGFGSLRLRRDLSRCLCTDTQDRECLSFCSVQTQTKGGNVADKRLKIYRGAFWEKRSRHALKNQT
ncbi:uncharacterized protein si:ch211-202p1.5 [Chelmon rostratus]|uniref:uncharacterized protein si:ch211-202p1.5 n=1 Tax=Chelmon rostratus TaxID=109905 RepID=UPI001BE98F67|nr:uncharacterized protein si:ch211-202p1.5 [Chelmon rostratus]